MTDLSRIKQNVSKMATMNAPEADIDGYIASEGVTVDDVRNHQLSDDANGKSSSASRFMTGAMDSVYGIGQDMAHLPSPLGFLKTDAQKATDEKYTNQIDSAAGKREADYEANKPEGFDWARLSGNVLSPTNLIGAGEVKNAATLGGKAIRGAISGAASMATMPVTKADDYATAKLEQMGAGAIGGATAPVVGRGLEKVLNPNTSPEVKTLLREGIRMTPGQMAGGAWKGLEDKITSVPLLGDVIRGAQNRSVDDLNRAAINRSLSPVGESLPRGLVGREAIEHAQTVLGDKYDALLPKLTGKVDQDFLDHVDAVSGLVQNLPKEQAQTFERLIQSQIYDKISKNGSLTGQTLKEIESTLGSEAQGYSADSSFDNRKLGGAIKEIQSGLRKMIVRSNPDHAKELSDINTGYANFKRVQRAAGAVGAENGEFSPAQLQNAVKALDKTKDKGSFAKGKALMQDLSDAAKSKLPSKVSDSGTAGRMAIGAGLFGLGGYASPATIPAGLAIASAYTPIGQKIAEALLTKRPNASRAIAPHVSKYLQYLGAPLAAPSGR